MKLSLASDYNYFEKMFISCFINSRCYHNVIPLCSVYNEAKIATNVTHLIMLFILDPVSTAIGTELWFNFLNTSPISVMNLSPPENTHIGIKLFDKLSCLKSPRAY